MRVCSGCLATDGRLFDIRKRLLEQAFAELTGLAECGGLLCVVCLQLLRKFSDFRARCLRSRRALQQLKPFNQDNFIQIDRTGLKHSFKRSEIFFLSCECCDSVETENLNTNIPHNVTIPSGGHNDTILLQCCIKSENDSSSKEKPMKIETYHIENINTYDNQTEIHIDILDNTQFSYNTDLTNPIDDINYENKCTNVDNITIETSPKYESLNINVDDTSKERVEAFEKDDDETSSNAGYNDDETKALTYESININDDEILKEKIQAFENDRNSSNAGDNNDKTKAPKYESININDDETLKEKVQAFENDDDDGISSNAGDNDDDFFKQKSGKKRKQLSANEKKISNSISQLFCVIWRNVIKDDGDFYGMFERLYIISLDKKLTVTTTGTQKRKIKNRTELENSLSFLSMYKQVADMNNVSIEFISIEAERLVMDSRRQSVDARQCALCCRVYATADTRRRHKERSHNENLPYRCLVCLYTFKKQPEYLMHLLKTHATRKTCKECGQNIPTFEQKSHWNEVHKHVNEVHRKSLVHCQYCDRSFTAPKHCYHHIRSAHRAQMDAVQCLLCGDTYNGRGGLTSHVVRIHPMAVKCDGCAIWFVSEYARVVHMVGGVCRKDLSGCPLCGYTFPTERLMREHYNGKHALYKCSKCILTFIELKSYKDHYNKMCYDGFRLPRAQNNKPQEKPATDKDKKKQYKKKDSYICDICGKGYDCAATLRYHQRLHTGEKPYKCEHCEKTFRLGPSLQIHRWTHTGERRYKCGLCQKAFRQPHHLKAHMPSHTNEKKYACTACSKRFTSNVSLRHHARTVHEGLSPHRRNRQKKKPLDVKD